jgi:hypothetical protein
MRNVGHVTRPLSSLRQAQALRKMMRGTKLLRKFNLTRAVTKALMFALCVMIILPGLAFSPLGTARAQRRSTATTTQTQSITPAQPATTGKGGASYLPQQSPVMSFPPINVREIMRQERLAPRSPGPAELRSINPPKGEPPPHRGVPILLTGGDVAGVSVGEPEAPLPSATGPSPGATKTFKGTESLVPVIPPDTDGAVGTTHIVSASNDRLRIQDRNGAIISTVTTNSFWSGLVLEGGATPVITDPRVRYDRFNNRFIFSIVANPQTLASATLIAVTATNDPTGTWYRYAIDVDPTATAAGGMWADFPSMGFNKDWIIIQDNLFGFGTSGTGYLGPVIYVIDKAAIYAGPVSLGAVPTFFQNVSACDGTADETTLGCGFTMSPSVSEDNTSSTAYLVEDWFSQFGQLRVSKITGTAAAPVLTVGTQFPQSTHSWRFNATRIQTSGGYLPQKQQSAYLVSGTRMMANDSRMQNVVLRNGSLWCVHHVMVATTPTLAGTAVGGVANRDNHTAIQWWQIDPSIETGLAAAPVQRARIEDPTADNCFDGTSALVATPPCSGSAANQHGTFFVFPSIAVNQNNDVLIGFSQFAAFHYGSAAYAYRASSDPVNTTRDPVVFHSGQSNDNLGGGAGASRQNRWGDYSMTQTDPINDSDFWTTQEYSGVYRDFGIGVVCPWETWWAYVSSSTPAPATSGNLVISEFRLRGPQGVRDEYVEVYNPGTSPIIVNTTDNSDGWALAYSSTAGVVTGIAVIPNGTVIPAKGHFLFADDPDSSGAGGLPTVVYSLGGYPANANLTSVLRNAESDTGWALDFADNGGLAIFKSATPANWTAATRMDSVGFSAAGINALYKEGTGLADLAASSDQVTVFRDLRNGDPQDTGNNASDFLFASTVGTDRGMGARLGAPGPENIDGPIPRTNEIAFSLIDPTVNQATVPNRVRSLTPVTNGTLGTMDVRRKITNYTGKPVTRLRFRFVDITTFPPPNGATADLRALTGVDIMLDLDGDTIPETLVKGLTLETPPAQALGGGWNASVTVTLPAAIPAGGSINAHFLYGVMQAGNFRTFIISEVLP